MMIFVPTTKYLVAFPSSGKYHVANKVSGTPVCGSPATLDLDQMKSIHASVGTEASEIHPAVCRRCVAACC